MIVIKSQLAAFHRRKVRWRAPVIDALCIEGTWLKCLVTIFYCR